ncbi:MAG: hypothetical protein LBQ20_06095 [Rhodanobacter sp.]|jgi:hypothetical protein|nr:hypothetical protein [Rhodanobacter sp.]
MAKKFETGIVLPLATPSVAQGQDVRSAVSCPPEPMAIHGDARGKTGPSRKHDLIFAL